MERADSEGVAEDCVAIRAYLDNPPYHGKSEYRNLREVKQLAGPTCCYDPARKLWGTACTDALQQLVVSRKWEPIGLTKRMHAPLVRAARAHRARAEAEWVAKQGAEKAAASATAKRTPASWLVSGAKPKMAKPSPAPAPAAPASAAPAAPAAAPKREATRFGVNPTDDEVDACAWMGLTPEAIAFSDTLNALGPRGTLSNEGRILRWCVALTSGARYEFAKTPDYFNPDVYLPAARQAHLEFAKDLNGQAVDASKAR